MHVKNRKSRALASRDPLAMRLDKYPPSLARTYFALKLAVPGSSKASVLAELQAAVGEQQHIYESRLYEWLTKRKRPGAMPRRIMLEQVLPSRLLPLLRKPLSARQLRLLVDDFS